MEFRRNRGTDVPGRPAEVPSAAFHIADEFVSTDSGMFDLSASDFTSVFDMSQDNCIDAGSAVGLSVTDWPYCGVDGLSCSGILPTEIHESLVPPQSAAFPTEHENNLAEQPDAPRRGIGNRGPDRLTVAAAGYGHVALHGWHLPAGLLWAAGMDDVVVGNDCTLRRTEQHDVRCVSLTFQGVLADGRVRDVLSRAVRGPYTEQLDQTFTDVLQRTLLNYRDAPEEAELPLAGGSGHVNTGNGTVMTGDGSHLRSTTSYTIPTVVLPGAELLADSRELRIAFIDAIRHGDAAEGVMNTFLAATLSAAKHADADVLLGYAAESGKYDATVTSFFFVTRVSGAGTMLAGENNTLIQEAEVDVARFLGDDITSAVAELHMALAPPSWPIAELDAAARRRRPHSAQPKM